MEIIVREKNTKRERQREREWGKGTLNQSGTKASTDVADQKIDDLRENKILLFYRFNII